MGGADTRGDAAAFRARSGSDARCLQSASASRLAHASYGGRGLSFCVAEDWSGHEIGDRRLPDYCAEGNNVVRTVNSGSCPDAGEVSSVIARRRDVPHHAGPLRERRSDE